MIVLLFDFAHADSGADRPFWKTFFVSWRRKFSKKSNFTYRVDDLPLPVPGDIPASSCSGRSSDSVLLANAFPSAFKLSGYQ